MPESLSRFCLAALHAVSEHMGMIRAEASVNNGKVRYETIDGLLAQSATSISNCVSVSGNQFRQGYMWQEDLYENDLADFVIEMATMKLGTPPETVTVAPETIVKLEQFVANSVMQTHEMAMISPFDYIGLTEVTRPPEMADIAEHRDWLSLIGGDDPVYGPNRVERVKPARRKLALRKK